MFGGVGLHRWCLGVALLCIFGSSVIGIAFTLHIQGTVLVQYWFSMGFGIVLCCVFGFLSVFGVVLDYF